MSMKWQSNYSKTLVTNSIISLFSYLKTNGIGFVLYQGLPGLMGSRGIIGETGSKVRKQDLALLSPLTVGILSLFPAVLATVTQCTG